MRASPAYSTASHENFGFQISRRAREAGLSHGAKRRHWWRMKRRRVVNGQVFLWTRRGWRLVKDGYIRTRRGWRKMRARPGPRAGPLAGRGPAPASIPVIEPAQPAAARAQRHLPDKYAALRPGHCDEAERSVATGSLPLSETPVGPRISEATIKAGCGSHTVKTFETQASLGVPPPSSASVPVS